MGMCMYIHIHVFSFSLSLLAMYNMIIISRNRYIKLFLRETRLVAFDATREGSPRKFYFFPCFFSFLGIFADERKKIITIILENTLKKLSKAH